MPSVPHPPFIGAKLLLFAGSQLVVLRRDFTPGIAWPGCLDFPGGGREGVETPEACALRETREEVGLNLPQASLVPVFRRVSADGIGWYFASHQPPEILTRVRFGGEGAGWGVMWPEAYVSHPDAIPHFAEILAGYLKTL